MEEKRQMCFFFVTGGLPSPIFFISAAFNSYGETSKVEKEKEEESVAV